MVDIILQPGNLFLGQLGGGLLQLIGKLPAGVGQRTASLGGFAGGVARAPLPCPLAGLVHLLRGKRGSLGRLLGLQSRELAGEPFRLLAESLLALAEPLQLAIGGLFLLLLGVSLDLLLQFLLPLFEGREIGLDAAEFLDQAVQLVLMPIGEDVEDLLQVLGDLFLRGGRLTYLILPNLRAGIPHLPADGQAAGFVQRVGDKIGGQRVALAKFDHPLLRFLQYAVQQPRKLKLPGRSRVQIGDVLRREVAKIAGQCAAADFRRGMGRVLLIAEQLRDVAVQPAVTIPTAEPVDLSFQRGDDRILPFGGYRQRLFGNCDGSGFPLPFAIDLGRLHRGGQLAAERRQHVTIEPIELFQQPVHPLPGVGVVDAVVLQIGQQRRDADGHAFAAAGQQLVDLALGVLGGLQAIDVRRLEALQIAQADLHDST